MEWRRLKYIMYDDFSPIKTQQEEKPLMDTKKYEPKKTEYVQNLKWKSQYKGWNAMIGMKRYVVAENVWWRGQTYPKIKVIELIKIATWLIFKQVS